MVLYFVVSFWLFLFHCLGYWTGNAIFNGIRGIGACCSACYLCEYPISHTEPIANLNRCFYVCKVPAPGAWPPAGNSALPPNGDP